MGRHRRSDAGRAATGRAMEVPETHGSYAQGRDPWDTHPQDHDHWGTAPHPNPDLYADASTRAEEYLYATDDDQARATDTVSFPSEDFSSSPSEGFNPSNGPRRRGRRRKKKAATPVRTGLLGVSAAVALGTVAVATGAVPGLENYKLGGGDSGDADTVQAVDSPTSTEIPQGGTSGSAAPDSRASDSPASRDAERSGPPTQSAPKPAPSSTPDTASPSATPSKTPSKEQSAAPSTPAKPAAPPAGTATKTPDRTKAPSAGLSKEAAAEAEVLRLVNEERAKVGCAPVAANSALSDLAGDFSRAMAEQGFFDHTDPSGASPWDRAAKAGITNLGGENIARGQADAEAVMEAWMNSPGHRANILNCDFKTLGVGVHFGPGGPWWTQNFGY